MEKHSIIENPKKLLDHVTIKEVASVFNVSEKHIRVTIKKLFPDLIKNGITTLLNEAHVTAIKMKIEKNPHLDQSVEVKTNLEKELLIQQAMMFQQEKIQTMQAEIANKEALLIEQAPKVEFYDTVAKSDKWLTFKEVANILNIPELGRNNLTKKLRELGYLTQFNKPYQKYITQKLFKVIESVHGKKVYTSTVVSQKGLDKLNKVLK